LVRKPFIDPNKENNELKKVHQILLYLKERPEEKAEAYFKEDIFTSPKFKKDKSKAVELS
jgi:hypothetical protein